MSGKGIMKKKVNSGGGIYKIARDNIKRATKNDAIVSIIKDLYNKIASCATKPPYTKISDFESAAKHQLLAKVQGAAGFLVSELEKACGNKAGTFGSSGISGSSDRFPDITVVDVDILYKKLDKKLMEYDTTLKELETQIGTNDIGSKKADEGTTSLPDPGKLSTSEQQIERERRKTYDERIRSLQRDVATLKEEVNAIVSFAQKASKETTPFLSNYYKSLLAVQSSLTGIVSTDTVSSYFPTGRESEDRLGRSAKDITGRLISLKLDIQFAKKDADKAAAKAKDNIPPSEVYFITKTDIEDDIKLKEYLTSSKPYYFFDIDGSKYSKDDKIIHITSTGKLPGTVIDIIDSKYTIAYDDSSIATASNILEKDLIPIDILKPTGVYRLYRNRDTYRSIEAVNGAGFLEVVKQYTRIKTTSGISEEDIFTFEKDICQYLFRLPENITTFSYNDILKSESIQTQLSYLAVIHQMHFIGTLLKKRTDSIEASVNPSKKDNAEEDILEKNKTEAEEIESINESIFNAIKTELNQKKKELIDVQEKIKQLNIPTQSWQDYYKNNPTLYKQNKEAEAEIKKYEDKITGYKKELAPYETKQEKNQSKIKSLLETIQANITDRSKLMSLLVEKGTLQKEIDDLNKGEITRLTNAINADKVAMNGLINTYITNGIFIGFFKKQEELLDSIKRLDQDMLIHESVLVDSNKNVQQANEALDIFKKEAGIEDEVYTVPEFHPVNSSKNSIDNALKQMFVRKYKYTQLFNLSEDAEAIIPLNSIDACIKLLFKYAHNPTFSIQTLEKVRGILEAGNIIPEPGVSETEAASKPGTIHTLTEKDLDLEKEESQMYTLNKEKEYTTQLRDTIIQLAHVFLVGQESFLAEAGIEKGKESKDPLVINKIDSATQRAIASLRTDPSKSAYDKQLAETKYAQIKDLMNQYKRLKIDAS